jgi:hypothetical protein
MAEDQKSMARVQQLIFQLSKSQEQTPFYIRTSTFTLANCFRSAGSQVQWEKTNPTPCFFRTLKTKRLLSSGIDIKGNEINDFLMP